MNAQPIWHDSVVEEIHRVRRELAEHHDHDLDAIAEAVDEQIKKLGLITQAPPPRTHALPATSHADDKSAAL